MLSKYLNFLLVIVYVIAMGAQTSFAGGDSRGGTKPRKKNAMRSDYLKNQLMGFDYKTPLTLFFNGFSRKAREHRNREEVAQLLKAYYESSPTIFERVKSLKLQIQHEDCLDNKGKPSPMSIKHVPENTVCVSTGLTAPDVTESDYVHQILGMLAHEVTHLALKSDDEELPDFIQDYYDVEVSEVGAYNFLASGHYALTFVDQALNRLMKLEDPSQICKTMLAPVEGLISSVSTAVGKLRPGQYDVLTKLDLQGEILVEVIFARAFFVNAYCPGQTEVSQVAKQFFGDAHEMPASGMFAQSQYAWPVPASIVLKRIELGSLPALKAELSVLKTEVEMLLTQLRRNMRNDFFPLK
ncbi:MAG: hypothetical protein K2X47_02755 [Bdellovibrionales bacterium]|nr:hypothetical protein [Bdellovibrionales bacterium]